MHVFATYRNSFGHLSLNSPEVQTSAWQSSRKRHKKTFLDACRHFQLLPPEHRYHSHPKKSQSCGRCGGKQGGEKGVVWTGPDLSAHRNHGRAMGGGEKKRKRKMPTPDTSVNVALGSRAAKANNVKQSCTAPQPTHTHTHTSRNTQKLRLQWVSEQSSKKKQKKQNYKTAHNTENTLMCTFNTAFFLLLL